MTDALEPIEPCERCGADSPRDFIRCGACGILRLRAGDGSFARLADPASTLRRIAAVLIDVALIAGPAWLTTRLPSRIADPTPAAQGEEALITAILTAGLIYLVVSVGATGRTLGKRLLGIHVVARDGGPIGYPRAGVREGTVKLLELAASTFIVVVLLRLAFGSSFGTDRHAVLVAAWVLSAIPALSLGLALADPNRRSLHDHLAGTLCVAGAPAVRAPTETGEPTETDLAEALPVPAPVA